MRRQPAVEKEWILKNSIEYFVMKEVEELKMSQVQKLVNLFKNGCESAYIARYKSDVHGGLAPERIRKGLDAYFDALDLNRKVVATTSTIITKVAGVSEKQNVIERLKVCEDIEEVAEISKEFSTGKRESKASKARDFGLEPPAQSILAGDCIDLRQFISNDLKTVLSVEEHLTICLADLMNRDPEVRRIGLSIAKLDKKCHLEVSANLTRDAAKNKKEIETKGILQKYSCYIGQKWRAHNIKDHTISALNRGTEEGIISWKVELNSGDARRIHPFSSRKVNLKMLDIFKKSLNYSITNYFIPMVQRGVKKFLLSRSVNRSILVFGQNVEQLFSQHGVRSKYVIALDPGKIVKAAFLEPSGKLISMNQFPIRDSSFDKSGVDILKSWSSQSRGKDIVFAIGNGCNTHNTQIAVSKMIEGNDFPEIDVGFCIVPEHGASKYSCTDAAKEEFGEDAEIKQISAVSIGRRLIDPLSEYVKIEPQHLGKGQYQLSVNDKLLKDKLTLIVRDRVSLIGADLNVASKALLQNICGLNQATAAGIVKYRERNGNFKSREELKRVKGIGDITFQQCAGFLTVSCPDEDSNEPPAKRVKVSSDKLSWSPFDETLVHPDDYKSASKLLEKLQMSIKDVANGVPVSMNNLTEEEKKIVDLLRLKPELKPPPPLMKKARALKDLVRGQMYTGTVSNKTDFGLFVDIGVERDGLVHISHFKPTQFPSQKSEKIEDLDIPAVGDQINVILDKLNGSKISLRPA
uniref:S1 motif domain-containing protein n=1 Tax=Caenorhabditis tropicalis TaxID=1561998 RepID=A0A1I7T0Z2_9PELO